MDQELNQGRPYLFTPVLYRYAYPPLINYLLITSGSGALPAEEEAGNQITGKQSRTGNRYG